VLVPAYALLVACLGLYGLHRLVLVATWWRTRSRPPVVPELPAVLPRVTVQIPVYNERDVVARVVEAVAALDWPTDRLQIQLLDDSTDDTAACAAGAVARARARGIDVDVRRRTARTGFKAGALAEGLRTATGELVAIFDADFIPAPDFLHRLVPHFSDPQVGMVQAAWGHLDRDNSALVRAQAALLDGHFAIEHTARHRGGHWFNFNGTAGTWRRSCIDDAGGWQGDTLTEDLDLSYRAQLRGWRFVYRPDVVVPAELPASVGAFCTQQRRWAKGSVQTARKLRPAVLRSGAPLATRLEALFHLHANLAWPLSLALAILLPFVAVLEPSNSLARHVLVDLPGFLVTLGGNATFYALAAPRGRRREVPLALLLAVGISARQSAAVVEGLLGRRGEFARTPKQGRGQGSYRSAGGGWPGIEPALATLHLGAAAYLVVAAPERWGSVPFLLLFAGGFGWVAAARFAEARARAESEGVDLAAAAAK
jgi:hypothetical protein